MAAAACAWLNGMVIPAQGVLIWPDFHRLGTGAETTHVVQRWDEGSSAVSLLGESRLWEVPLGAEGQEEAEVETERGRHAIQQLERYLLADGCGVLFTPEKDIEAARRRVKAAKAVSMTDLAKALRETRGSDEEVEGVDAIFSPLQTTHDYYAQFGDGVSCEPNMALLAFPDPLSLIDRVDLSLHHLAMF